MDRMKKMKSEHGSAPVIGPAVRFMYALIVQGIGGGDGGGGGGGDIGGGGGIQPALPIVQMQGVPGMMSFSGIPATGAPTSTAMTPVGYSEKLPPG